MIYETCFHEKSVWVHACSVRTGKQLITKDKVLRCVFKKNN